MSLVLKKDLVVEDAMIAGALHTYWKWDVVTSPFKESFYLGAQRGQWNVSKGTQLPEGPLHPIAAQAFGMAGFVLEDETSMNYVWYSGDWYYSWDSGEKSDYPTHCPHNAVIVGHQDPEVL